MESGEIGGEKESEGSEEDGIIEERNAKIPRKNGAEIGGERSDRQTNGTQLQEEFGADVKNEVFNCEMERNGRILEGNNKFGFSRCIRMLGNDASLVMLIPVLYFHPRIFFIAYIRIISQSISWFH